MKSLILSFFFVSFAQAALAGGKMVCDVEIAVDGEEKVVQTYELPKSKDPHGAIDVVKLSQFGGITLLLGVQPDDTAVISIYSDKLEIGSSSKGNVSGYQAVQHQLILPSPGVGVNSIIVFCQSVD